MGVAMPHCISIVKRFLFSIVALLPCYCPAALWPGDQWPVANPVELGIDTTKLAEARDYAVEAEGSGCIIVQGRLVMSWGNQSALYDLKSTSKSIGVTVLGLALQDGKLKLDDLAKRYHPSFGMPPEANAQSGWLDTITLRMLANQTAGFAKPGGFEPLLFAPGTKWHYSDGGPNWLAECLTLIYGRDLNEVLFERVFTPIGIKPADIRWRKNAYRPDLIEGIKRREFGSGFSANVQAMSRLGYLYLRHGEWDGQRILPREFVDAVRRPGPELAGLPVNDRPIHGNAAAHYGLLWWNNGDAAIASLPRDAYWSWGLYDSLIVVVPSLDLVVARAGKSWKRAENADHYDVLKPFLEPIAASLKPNDRR
jgi:CubicO group peptidase (beta-lactamase class C family)